MLELMPFAILVFYLVPFFVAVAKNHDGAMGLLALNLLLGWTVVGWLVLLGVALATSAEGHAIPSRKSRPI